MPLKKDESAKVERLPVEHLKHMMEEGKHE